MAKKCQFTHPSGQDFLEKYFFKFFALGGVSKSTKKNH